MKGLKGVFCALAGLLAIIATSAAVRSATIEAISHSFAADGRERVTFTLSEADTPKVFTITGDSPRLVLDFVGATYRGRNIITPEQSKLVGAIRVGVHLEPVEKVRIVVDLSSKSPVDHALLPGESAKILTYELSGAVADAVAQGASVKEAAKPAKPVEGATDAAPPPAMKTELAAPPAVAEGAAATQKTHAPQEVAATGDMGAATPPPVATMETAGKVQGADTQAAAVKEGAVAGQQAALGQQVAPGQDAAAISETVASQEAAVKAQALAPQKDDAVAVAEKPVAEASPAEPKEKAKPRLVGVSFDDSSAKGEMVLFHLNGFYPPAVSAVEKDLPMVFCDFTAMDMDKGVEASIAAKGKYVERISTGRQGASGRIRATLHLVPNRDYDLQQVFFKNDNLFVLIVNELQPTRAD
jgi:hypothetical protein